MINSLQRFWRDETGPELVEWAVVTIILLVAAVVLYIAVGKALGAVICSVQCWLKAVVQPDTSSIDKNSTCQNIENDCDQNP